MSSRAFVRALGGVILAIPSCVILHDYRGSTEGASSDASSESPAATTQHWGDHARGLAVRACNHDGALVVNTVSDSRDDAGRPGELSLRQALLQAAERPGPDTIAFDEAVFRVERPGIIEWLGGVIAIDEVCLDARGRGVIVRSPGTDGTWEISGGSLVVGLELYSAGRMNVGASQIAGCRIGTDGRTGYGSARRGVTQGLLGSAPDGAMRTLTIDVDPSLFLYGAAELGPGNVLFRTVADHEAPGIILNPRDAGPGQPRIFENFFGYDPLTDSLLTGAPLGMELSGSTVERNVFATPLAMNADQQGAGPTVFRTNHVGLRPDAAPFAIPSSRGVVLQSASNTTIGPENTFYTESIGIEADWKGYLLERASLRITRNRFVRAEGSILHFPDIIAPPQITAAEATGVSGTCAAPGTVELFVGNDGLADEFIGEATCDTTWHVTADPSRWSGRDVTATITGASPEGGLITSAFSAPLRVP